MGVASTIEDRVEQGLETRGDEHDLAIKTWRYLRLGLIALTLGLVAAIGYERLAADCWQTSISAYYYTPARGVVVGALVAIGVSLICLRGASDGEDVLLNLAGICAPFVALVPTPNEGACASVPIVARDLAPNVANNITALLVAAWASLAFLTAVSVVRLQRRAEARPAAIDVAGYGVAVTVVLVTTVVFVADRDLFLGNAHHAAAILLFFFVFLNVCLNAVQRYLAEQKAGLSPTWNNRYTQIAAIMLADVAVHVVLASIDWTYWVLTIELSLIVLFAGFWAAQTSERWKDGITPSPRPREPDPDTARTLTTTG